MHLQTTGFMTSAHAWSNPKTREKQFVLIHTWVTGYPKGLDLATQVKLRGDYPILLKLACQDSPDSDFWREVRARDFALLSLSSKFAGDDWVEADLITAVKNAWQQTQWGLGGSTSARSLSPTPQVTQTSTTIKLTDDERRDYLRAMYSNTGDDGAR